MSRRLLLAVFFLFLVQSARADDAHSIKMKVSSEGDTILVERTATQATRSQILNADGKVYSDDRTTIKENFLYKETILAKEAGKAVTKVRREYEKALLTRGDKTVPLSFHGKTLIIEKEGDKSHVFDGDKELADKDVLFLDEGFNRGAKDIRDFEKFFIPADPVKVDEAYRLDMPPLIQALVLTGIGAKMEVEVTKAEGTGRLVKAYTRDNRPFGRFAVQFSVPVTTMVTRKAKYPALEGSKLTSDVDLDLLIDGSSVNRTTKMAVKLDISAMSPAPEGGNAKFIVSIRNDVEETEKELPKK